MSQKIEPLFHKKVSICMYSFPFFFRDKTFLWDKDAFFRQPMKKNEDPLNPPRSKATIKALVNGLIILLLEIGNKQVL